MRWPRVKLVFLGTAAALLLTCAIAFGGTVPNTLNYQGTLYDGAGQLVTGTKDITVSLYDTASGGTPFWSEKQTAVILKNGNFSVALGKTVTNPINQTKLTGDTYIGIAVDAEPEMVPRQQFTSVAYALKSGDGVPIGAIIMWKGGINEIPIGWALCDGKNGTPDLQDRFIVGAGSSYTVNQTGGNATVNLQHSHLANDHTHAVGMDAQGNHTHTGKTNGNSDSSDRTKDDKLNDVASNPHYHTFTTDPAGVHTHNAWTGGASDRNTDSRLSTAQDIRPPFYSLAFIMKVQ